MGEQGLGPCLWSTTSLGCVGAVVLQQEPVGWPQFASVSQLAGHTDLSLPCRVFDLCRESALIGVWTQAFGQTFQILWVERFSKGAWDPSRA
jgi:hypothetical protein